MNPHAIVAKIRLIDKQIEGIIQKRQRAHSGKVKIRYENSIRDLEAWRETMLEDLAKATGGKKKPKYWPDPAKEEGDYVVFVDYMGHMIELVSVRSLMGPICWESPATPYTCSVQSETYWSS